MVRVELEVRAAILEQHPSAFGHDARAEVIGHALDQRDQVAMLVRRAEIDGVPPSRRGVHPACRRGLRIQEQVSRRRSEIRVGDVTVAKRVARVPGGPKFLACFEPQRHRGRHQADRRRRQLVDDHVAVGECDRLHPLRAVQAEVLPRDQPVALLDRRHESRADLAPIEAVDPVAGDVAQSGGEVGVSKQHPGLHRRIQRVGRALASKPVRRALQVLGQVRRDQVSAFGERGGRLQDRAQTEAAEPLE